MSQIDLDFNSTDDFILLMLSNGKKFLSDLDDYEYNSLILIMMRDGIFGLEEIFECDSEFIEQMQRLYIVDLLTRDRTVKSSDYGAIIKKAIDRFESNTDFIENYYDDKVHKFMQFKELEYFNRSRYGRDRNDEL